MVYQKYQMYIYCIHLFMLLFVIPSQNIIGKILGNLWQRLLEKPLMLIKRSPFIETGVTKNQKHAVLPRSPVLSTSHQIFKVTTRANLRESLRGSSSKE